MVRRLVGYDRLELPALAALEQVHDLSRDYVNFLHPVRKLATGTNGEVATASSLVVVVATAILGLAATLVWWDHADQTD